MAYLGPHLYSEDSDDIIEPASDVFEIDDFTSPSDWEKFVARLEHLIRDWGLDSSDCQNDSDGSYLPSEDPVNDGNGSYNFLSSNWIWKEISTTLTFYEFQFLVKRYWRIDTSKAADSVDKSDTMKKNR